MSGNLYHSAISLCDKVNSMQWRDMQYQYVDYINVKKELAIQGRWYIFLSIIQILHFWLVKKYFIINTDQLNQCDLRFHSQKGFILSNQGILSDTIVVSVKSKYEVTMWW